MRLYSYIVLHDMGFAPNPFHGWCTLATCKPRIRGGASVGDWIAGTGSKSKGLQGRLVYAMRVDEKVTFDQYWQDPRFQRKKPDMRGSWKYRYGDNIYHRSDVGGWDQADSRHSLDSDTPNPKHVTRDTGKDAVLLSTHFTYWGGQGPTIPTEFRNGHGVDICLTGTGEKWTPFSAEMRLTFLAWIDTLDLGYNHDPADW
jgi:hypothetical protein